MPIAFFLLLGVAAADEPAGTAWALSGELRGRGEHTAPFVIDNTGTLSDQSLWLASRLIVGVEGELSARVTTALELEALNGLVAGDTTALGTARGEDSFAVARHDRGDLAVVLPRKAKLQLGGSGGSLLLGFDTFGWGSGILSNDGRGDPLFGDAWRGNVVGRLGGVLTPFRTQEGSRLRGLALIAAGDLVVRDDNAELYEGDRAVQAVGGALWRGQRGQLGLLASYRHQRDREDPHRPGEDPSVTRVVPIDASFRYTPALERDALALLIEGELATIHGHTTRPYGAETAEDGAAVHSLGALLRGRLDHDPSGLSAIVEGGYASGDNDSADDVARGFRFHSDHGVGIVLFEQVMPMLSARAVDRASDPALLAVPPSATRFAISQGEVSNAIYAFPAVTWRPVAPVELRAGWVRAHSAGDLIDVYNTARMGGYNTGYGGVTPTSRHMGDELDLGLRSQLGLGDDLSLDIGAEAGVFLPGAAFEGLDLDTVYAARLRADLRW
jgi:hypothetical protein